MTQFPWLRSSQLQWPAFRASKHPVPSFQVLQSHNTAGGHCCSQRKADLWFGIRQGQPQNQRAEVLSPVMPLIKMLCPAITYSLPAVGSPWPTTPVSSPSNLLLCLFCIEATLSSQHSASWGSKALYHLMETFSPSEILSQMLIACLLHACN